VEWEDGNEYPLIVVDVTSESHPFWTGAQRVMDTAGRVEKFQRRYGNRVRPYQEERVGGLENNGSSEAPSCPARTPTHRRSNWKSDNVALQSVKVDGREVQMPRRLVKAAKLGLVDLD
jgi:hypothetical protein